MIRRPVATVLAVLLAVGGGAGVYSFTSVATATASTATPAEDFPVDADYCYVDGMIPHHDQAILMSDIVVAKDDTSDRVRRLAEFITQDQTLEIEAMRAWQDAWVAAVEDLTGETVEAGHQHGAALLPDADPIVATGCSDPAHVDPAADSVAAVPATGAHLMEGMATEEQLDELRAASGVDSDRIFLELMIVHHVGALEMAETAIREGANPFTVSSARHVLIEQDREVVAMQEMLALIEETGAVE